MDFDALVNVKRILSSDKISQTDIMLLTSAINNENVNINISIQDNLDIIQKQDINNNEFMIYLNEFIGVNQEFLNTPIYKFFLKRKPLWTLLLIALKMKLLNGEVLSDIIKYFFSLLPNLEQDEYLECLVLINDFLSIKKISNIKKIDNPDSIIEFISHNLDCLEAVSYEETYQLICKNIIIKLFSLGFISFSDSESYAIDENEFVISVISPFLNQDEYYYLISIINENTVDIATLSVIRETLLKYISSHTISKEANQVINKILENLDEISISEQKQLNIK